MRSPLARALLKVGAVLVAFVLLGVGVWCAVVRYTDDRLLSQLDAVPGLSQVSVGEDRVEVHVATDLSPAAAKQTVDRVMQIAKNQQLYRARPVELIQGVFRATMTASAPNIPAGDYRGDVANLLNTMGGIAAGSLGMGGAVAVELMPDQNQLEWAVNAAMLLEGNGLRESVQVSNGSTELTFQMGVPDQRHLLWAAHEAITAAGGAVESLELVQRETGTRLSGLVNVPNREVAIAVLPQIAGLLAQPSAANGFQLQITDDVRLVGIGDVPSALGFIDHLAGEGIDVVLAQTDRSRVELEVASPQAIELLLAKAAEPGWALPGDGQLSISPTETEYGGLVANNATLATRAQAYQQLWAAGFPDIFVGHGDAHKGAQMGFLAREPEINDFTDPQTQAALITALRGLDWAGLASFSLSPDPRASTLTFLSTATGEASDVVKPRPLGGRWWHRAGWGTDFVEQWDATAGS